MSEEEKKVVAAEETAANPMDAVIHDPDAPIITMKKLLEAGIFRVYSFVQEEAKQLA